MRIMRITLGRTINVGDYESVRFDLTAEVSIGEDWEKAFRTLRKEVDATETRLRREYKNR